jgi:hypothetical protein
MSYKNILPLLILSSLAFIGCSDEFDLEFPAPEPSPRGGVTVVSSPVALNPTEQKLRGEWYLRSMSAKDTLYNDSVFNRSKTITFSEFAVSGKTRPILFDYMGLYARLTPDSSVFVVMSDETWQAPDSSTLKIFYEGLYFPADTVTFGIEKLALYQLTIVDSTTGKKWNFER